MVWILQEKGYTEWIYHFDERDIKQYIHHKKVKRNERRKGILLLTSTFQISCSTSTRLKIIFQGK